MPVGPSDREQCHVPSLVFDGIEARGWVPGHGVAGGTYRH